MSFLYNLISGKSSQNEDPTGLTGTGGSTNNTNNGTGNNGNSDSVLLKDFTPRELSNFDGHLDPKIYIAIKGSVFDCSLGRQFYGPSGPYSNFAGHDASRGLATNSFDIEVIKDIDDEIDNLEGLSEQQIEALNGWYEHFKRKYVYVGNLVPEK
ncbi:hypothetical protein QEN19_001416 [Hanseniaspora menglaensis]